MSLRFIVVYVHPDRPLHLAQECCAMDYNVNVVVLSVPVKCKISFEELMLRCSICLAVI